MASQIPIARKYCANWDRGICLGCMFKRVDGELFMNLDKKFAEKNEAQDEHMVARILKKLY